MSKTKVVYTKEKFFVNKEKKTVACVIDFEINLLEIGAVQRMLNDNQFSNFIASISYDSECDFGVCKFKVSGKINKKDHWGDIHYNCSENHNSRCPILKEYHNNRNKLYNEYREHKREELKNV